MIEIAGGFWLSALLAGALFGSFVPAFALFTIGLVFALFGVKEEE